MTKELYGRVFIDREALTKEGIDYPIKVEYFKIYDEIQNKEKNQFGIEVVKSEFRNNDVIIENKKVRKITNEEEEINRVLNLLKTNQVTPISAGYIIDDLTYNTK